MTKTKIGKRRLLQSKKNPHEVIAVEYDLDERFIEAIQTGANRVARRRYRFVFLLTSVVWIAVFGAILL